MKVFGKSSLSSKIKFVLDASWLVGCLSLGVWIVVAFFLVAGSLSCSPGECSSSATVSNVGFKMDSKSSQLTSKEGAIAFFSDGKGKLTIDGPVSTGLVIAMIIEGTVIGSLFLFVILQLRKLFESFVRGVPFSDANAKLLRVISVCIFGISFLSGSFSFLNAFLLNQQFKGEGIELVSNGDFNLTTIFASAVVFILAEIFRLGSQLEDERAHTV